MKSIEFIRPYINLTKILTIGKAYGLIALPYYISNINRNVKEHAEREKRRINRFRPGIKRE